MFPPSVFRKSIAILLAIAGLTALVLATTASGAAPTGTLAYSELPDPLAYGSYVPKELNPVVFGETTFQEPNSRGEAATKSNSAITLQIRGNIWQPENYPGKSPLIVFVHGNHGECDSGEGPNCTIFKRNDEGYAYMGKNLASWGYTVVSLDQDQLMARQDSLGKGMHARRLLILALLDKIKAASEAPLTTEGATIGSQLVGKVDMTRIGLMGHSRGGDAVSSFILYDQTLPAGERFPLRAVVSIAPVDYERHAPYGVPYMSVFGSCDGDVSNLQGARLYERSQYTNENPYPSFQVIQVGGNHDAYNTVWQADGDDAGQLDAACGPDAKGSHGQVPEEIKPGEFTPENVLGELTGKDPDNIRLSGEAGPYFEAIKGEEKPYRWGNSDKLNPAVNTRMSGEPALMGDQEKMGLATVAAFLRRYVGGEGAFEPYLTGELAAEGKPSIPQSACPTSDAGRRIPCIDRVADSYTAPADERLDVLRPDTEHPTTLDALGTAIEASGFANPYPKSGGIQPRPATTANGIDWCDPDPHQAEPPQLKEPEFPVASKSCPQPAAHTLGGQGSLETPGAEATNPPRENAPVNGSYGRQLALAWEGQADLGLKIPAADGDVSGYRALYMATAVNFFDPRNPSRGAEGLWNPEYAPQNWTIAVTDSEGHEGTVEAADPAFGTATQQTLGDTSDRVHVLLRDLRVPLAEFAAQGVDLAALRKLELRFGGQGMPSSGSIQLADVRFQQPASGFSDILLDSTEPDAGPGEGAPAGGPDPVTEIEDGTYQRANGEYEIPNVTTVPGANVWTVDDDGVQCPNAEFEHIQEAVEYANPWDTIVVCPGVYYESSTPINSELNPVLAEGERDGLTITKPLKIIGAGAEKVTIKPATALSTLGGATGTLRDGGGNVITVSRQSLGSTEYDEEYVDISGVKVESGSTTAEAGIAFFNASGRIADSEIGRIRAANGNGWGVVMTNSEIGEGPGTAERQVTIERSKIAGYATGGVLFDDSKGKADGTATNTERSGIKQIGYVKRSTIEGSGGTSATPQTGIAVRSGARVKVNGSAIVKNRSAATAPSYGILAADAGALSLEGSYVALNGAAGYGLYNGNAESTEAKGVEVVAADDYWGLKGTPKVESESAIATDEETGATTTDEEGIKGPVATTIATTAPIVPPVPPMPDAAPVGGIVDPAGGEAVEAGVAVEPVVHAEDDYGIRSVSLLADGVPVESKVLAPFAFEWTPTQAQIGTTVTLQATITDSAGQTVTSTVAVPVERSEAEVAAEVAAATERKTAEELASAEAQLKGALASAQAAAAEGKVTAEKAEAAVKALEEKIARIEARLKGQSHLRVSTVTANPRNGTVRLGVVVPGAGALTLSGPDVVKVTGHTKAAGEVELAVKAKGSALKALKAKGHISVKAILRFTADGESTSLTKTVGLRKK